MSNLRNRKDIIGAIMTGENDSGKRQPLFSVELCASRADVFRMIPDVRRNLAISAFERVIADVRLGSYSGALDVSPDDVEDVDGIRSGGQFETPVITPKGARLLLRMLEAGMIPQHAGTAYLRRAPDLAAYAAREEELARLTLERAARNPEQVKRETEEAAAARKARIAHLAKHPEEARPEEIKRWMIDQVFIARHGFGAGGVMEFGDVTCHKKIHHWVSNKGYRHTEIVIWWTDKNGRRWGDAPFSEPLNRRARGGENIHKYNRDLRLD
jgi:hypothetical protein